MQTFNTWKQENMILLEKIEKNDLIGYRFYLKPE